MPTKPQFDCDTVFPRIALYIREAEGYIEHGDLVAILMDDGVVRGIAPDIKTAFRVAQKAVGLFSAHFTMKRTKFGMESYRREFSRKREGDYWAYASREKTR